MILVADSGSTKTNWCIVEQGKCIQLINTQGINPYFQSEMEILNLISTLLVPQLNTELKAIRSVHFYGAGCAHEKVALIEKVLSDVFDNAFIEVATDLLGAARGICGNHPGIVCIMGTGSNSCFYDGNRIIKNVAPLGFILGDEGSGAVLGKVLVADLLKEVLPIRLKEKFLRQYHLTPAKIIDIVYRRPFPNRFLASMSPFLADNIHEPAIHGLVLTQFISFIERNVKKYDYQNYSANFVGSVAYYYKAVLSEAASKTGIKLGSVLQSPAEGLIAYHT